MGALAPNGGDCITQPEDLNIEVEGISVTLTWTAGSASLRHVYRTAAPWTEPLPENRVATVYEPAFTDPEALILGRAWYVVTTTDGAIEHRRGNRDDISVEARE